jgi:hypothetical protein
MQIDELFDRISDKRDRMYKAENKFKKALKKEFRQIRDVGVYDFYPTITLKDNTHIYFSRYNCDLYFDYHFSGTCVTGTSSEEIIQKTKEKIKQLEKYLKLGKQIYKTVLNKELDVNKFNIYQQLQKLKGKHNE